MSIELFINIVVICLLVPTIIFAIILNKRLEVLRNSRADLGRLIEAFNDATTRAESGIPRLKQAADSAGALRDDMAFMIERADTIVQRLENSMRSVPSSGRPADNPAEEFKPAPSFASKAKKKRVLAENPEDLISSAVSAAQDILRDVEGPKAAKTAKKAFVSAPEEDIGADRSEAERELLKALQSMR